MAEEMQNALNSYGKVAMKRCVYNVPMMCIEIMQNFADKMIDVLSQTTDEEIDLIDIAPEKLIEKRNMLNENRDIVEGHKYA